MKTSKIIISVFIVFSLQWQAIAQTSIGEWHEHLPYLSANSLAEVGDQIYCSTKFSLFYYGIYNGEMGKLSKVNGLSDVGINVIKYNEEANILMVAYQNANIDLLKGNMIYNLPDIKDKIMTGTKTINNILFINKMAYLSCGFGIVVIDLENREVKETWYIADGGKRINVYELAFDGNSLFAATEKGIYQADINNSFLANYSNWHKFENLPVSNQKFNTITIFNGKLFTNFKNENDEGTDTIYVYDYTNWSVYENSVEEHYKQLLSSYGFLVVVSDKKFIAFDTEGTQVNHINKYNGEYPKPISAIFDRKLNVWIADDKYGLVYSVRDWITEFIHPNGPYSSNVYDIEVKDSKVWVASGGRNLSWGNLYAKKGVYTYQDNQWESFYNDNTDEIHQSIWDITEIAIDPRNSNHVYAGSWGGGGILEFENNQIVEIHNDSNSTLQSILAGAYCKIGGMDFDQNNNLWVSNPGVPEPVSMRRYDGEWFSFPYSNSINADVMGDIIATQSGAKWIILPRGYGLFIFDERGTYEESGDDLKVKISVQDEDGEIINDIYSIAEDKDGAVWVGTNLGVLVYYNSYSVLQDPSTRAQRIIVEIDGTPQHLLGTETVTAITIDGANRKWFGTEGGGVFLMSEDATEQILNFNVNNSPILSNSIKSISIDDETGDVYFGTDKGIISYRGKATEGESGFNNLYVYPNPIRPGYEGEIIIKGTTAEAIVKITDVSGNLVYETESLGGQAIWDGKDFSGRKVSTGVYLVFCSNPDGSETEVTKLLFIK
ncbi:MAG: two-component regulator propeller domain-containing protein [Bacteroidota bacterium]|nr:two-component regulator propeller domain-containing protein [Bacteroidota bacterium]